MSRLASQTDIDRLAAPGDDGDCLIHPDPAAFAAWTRANRAALSASPLRILDRPLKSLRDAWVGDSPVVMTGHQPEWMHPGVWIKNVAAAELAARLGGRAVFLIVDSDVPAGLNIPYPDRSADPMRRAYAPAPRAAAGRAYEHLASSSPDDWNDAFAAIPTDPDSGLAAFQTGFQSVPTQVDGHAAGYVDRWCAAVSELDREIGVSTPSFLRISDVFSGRGPDSGAAAMTFTAAIILAARESAAAYNAALQAYRDRRDIRGTRHPIPDLEVHGPRVELPFWVVHPDRPRRRLFVEAQDRSVVLFSETDQIGEIEAASLRLDPAASLPAVIAPLGLRPRALAQTLFVRLVCCDLFIHGVGGAKYDQITDDLIQRFYNIDPPAFACVSATLRLPLDLYGVSPEDVRAHARQARDVMFNPQRYVTVENPEDPLAQLAARRTAAIEDSVRLRTESPGDRPARRDAWRRIRQANHDILHTQGDLHLASKESAQALIRRLEHDRIAGGREWFYALHPIPRLRALRDRVCSEFSNIAVG
ncbi:MAG: hypothetical protein AMXMBFR20_07940 [Planctomycetia bacterium]